MDAAPPALRPAPVVEIEGDGLEGQRPPRQRAAETPDDPTEPFSPNYGSMPPVLTGWTPEPA